MTWVLIGAIAVGMGVFTVVLCICAALMNRAIEVYYVVMEDGPAGSVGDTPPVGCEEEETGERSVARG